MSSNTEKDDQTSKINKFIELTTEYEKKVNSEITEYINEYRKIIISLNSIKKKVLDDSNYQNTVFKLRNVYLSFLTKNDHVGTKMKETCLLTIYNIVVLINDRINFDREFYENVYDEFFNNTGSLKLYAALILSQWKNLDKERNQNLVQYFENIINEQPKTEKIFGIDMKIIQKNKKNLNLEEQKEAGTRKIKLFMKDLIHEQHTNVEFDISKPIKELQHLLPNTKDALEIIYLYHETHLKEDVLLSDYNLEPGSNIYYAMVMKPPADLNEFISGNVSEIMTTRINGEDIVLKRYQIIKNKNRLQELAKPVLIEVASFALLQNKPNVVKLKGLFKKETSKYVEFYIGMEKMQDNLEHYLNENGAFKHNDVLDIVDQLLSVLKILHDKQMIHRNIKCSSIFVNENKGKLTIKLSNFSLSKYMYGFDKDEMQKGIVLSKDLTFSNYVAPEVIQDHLYGSSSDIWSIGVLMLYLLGKPPFTEGGIQQKTIAMTANPPYFASPPNTSSALQGLIKSCLQYDPEKRPTADELSTSVKKLKK